MSASNKYKKRLADFLGIRSEENCSPEVNKQLCELLREGKELPPGYRRSLKYGDFFFKDITDSLSIEEMQGRVLLEQAEDIKTIKKCVLFLTILTVLIILFLILISI